MQSTGRQSSAVSAETLAAPQLSVYVGPGDVRCGGPYEPQVWTSVSQIDICAWESLRDPNDLFMDVRLLRVVETSMAGQTRLRFVLFRDSRGRPAAAACLCTYTVDSTVLAGEGVLQKLTAGLKRIAPRLVQFQILFCGLPFSGGQSHLRFAPGVDRAAILRSLDSILRDVARADGAQCIALKEFNGGDLESLAALESLGYRRADSLPMNHFLVEHANLEEFLASLHNRKRYEIRKSLKKAQQTGLRTFATSDPGEIERLCTPRVYDMYRAVVAKAKTKLELLPREFFIETARRLPENCEYHFARHGDDVLGFGLCLFSGTTYHPLVLGVDYARNRDHDVYFNLMILGLDRAMRRGMRNVHMGQDADELKCTKFGCRQTSRYFFIKGAGAVMDGVIRLLFKQLFPQRPLLAPMPALASDVPAARRSA
ncbi:MAG: GNAT family N-acetyltransferase [Planctomycetaceae bacterium]